MNMVRYFSRSLSRIVLTSTILAFVVLISLSGCDSDENVVPGIPVGTELPNGFVVNESVGFPDMDTCVDHAINVREEMSATTIGETRNNTSYTSASKFTDGTEMIQMCSYKTNTFTNYASARKHK